MERNVNFAYIGGLFLAVLVVMVAFLIWMGGSNLNQSKYSHYVAYSNEGITGVGEGVAIRYKGILVGRVAKVAFEDSNTNLVRFDLSIESNIKLLNGACISAENQGLTGGVFLSITQGSGETLNSGDELCYQKGFIGRLLDNIEQSGGDAREIIAEIRSIFGEENGKNIHETIIALRMILQNLEQTRQGIEKLSNTANEAIANINSSLQRGDYNIRQIISPAMLGVENSLNEMNRFFSKANLLLDRLEKSPYDAIFGQREKGGNK